MISYTRLPHVATTLGWGRRPLRLVVSIVLVIACMPVAFAQWSSDAATNLVVADGPDTQVQPKVVPTADGGVYISWYEGSGFDVRLQKLDAAGNALFADEGVLVADRSFSSTQDYGLSVDAAGNALVIFRDDRSGGVDITAALVTPTGEQPWGANGVQLTNTTEFVGMPLIAGTSDGGSVVAWTQNESSHVQKLDADGDPQWTEDVVLTPSAGLYFASDLQAQGTEAILSIHHQTGSFGSPRHLLAQKFDVDGDALWGSEPLAVFDGGSLQIGNFPTFVPDGSGGGVFSWYDVAGASLQAYVQRILSDGTEAFAHNGLAVSTNTTRERVAPDVAFDAATEEIYVYWLELANAQALTGVSGQKFNASGARRWTDEGLELVAPAAVFITSVQAALGGPGAFAFWGRGPSFGQDQIFGANASGDASSGIDVFGFNVSNAVGPKGRIAAVNSTEGFTVVVWQDARSGNEDIYAQNVNPDGSLGIASAVFDVDVSSLAFQVEAGRSSEAQTVTLTNSGAGAGTFSTTSTVTPDGVVLVADPASGTVGAGDAQPISVVADASAAAPGSYTAELLIETDGADMPSFTVEVTIEVMPAVANEDGAAPAAFALGPSYPNPFAGQTTVGYDLAEPVHVSIEVYDVMGRRVATLVDEAQSAGRYEVTWDAQSHPSGVYLYRIDAGTFHETRKIVLAH